MGTQERGDQTVANKTQFENGKEPNKEEAKE